jgi:hypothetical protein
MTLSGVLKDILLVVASMLIFRDPVAPVQFFGYSIALGGLVYYKLGGEKLKEHVGSAQRSWAEYGVNHPAARKIIVFLAVIVTMGLLVGGLTSAGALGEAYTAGAIASTAGEKLGAWKNAGAAN